MGPRARRSSPRATQTRGPVAGTTRLDRRHEPARAQPTRTGHVAKQVLLVIGVAQVITRALSRLDEMALREGSDIRAFRQLARLSFLRAKSMEHMQIWPGEPYPLGANFDGTGTNFSLFSELAECVELCLFDDQGNETRVDLPEVDGFRWHGYLPHIEPGMRPEGERRLHGPASSTNSLAGRALRRRSVRRSVDEPTRGPWAPRPASRRTSHATPTGRCSASCTTVASTSTARRSGFGVKPGPMHRRTVLAIGAGVPLGGLATAGRPIRLV